MATQITLKNIIDEIVLFGNIHLSANTSSFGDFEKVGANGNTVFPLWHCDYLDCKITDKRIEYRFNIACANKKIHDDSNLIEIYNDTNYILHQYYHYLIHSINYKNKWKIEPGTTIRAFPFRFIDGLAGHVMDITISVDNYTTMCDVAIEGGAS